MPDPDTTPEILTALQTLGAEGQIIEIRILGDDGVASGYFDSYEMAAREIRIRDRDSRVSGIYLTLNEVNPSLLSRRANRIKTRLGKCDATTGDADIIRRRWLPIDIDPCRPSGISSSEAEHADALCRADTIREFLASLGWPDPVVADSGNGAHLLYPIDLPNDEESRGLIRSVLELLDSRFSDDRCKVDTANFNAARIWKMYGTVSRKGDPTAARPHRRSRILHLPAVRVQVTTDQLRCLAPEPHLLQRSQVSLASPLHAGKPGPVQDGTIDLEAWLSAHGLSAVRKPYQGGSLYVLETCPFSSAHTDGAFAIQFQNGAIFAGCHHDSCGAGRQRWHELRAMYEPDRPDIGARLARLRSDRIRAKREAEGNVPYHEYEQELTSLPDETPTGQSDDIRARSREILTRADPLSYMLETFSRYHEGDKTVAECLIHSLVSRTVVNSKGLHVSITGESGKGKSHAIETMRSLIPEDTRIDGRMSDKALFYMEDLKPGTVITLDDVSLSDQMQEVLKGVTTSFQRPFLYRTVNKDRKSQVCTIPERCVWWIAKVEGAGDDQIFNRMLTCWIDDSEEQDIRVLDRTLADAEQVPDDRIPVSDEVQVCRCIYSELQPVWVVIPYARKIRFQSAANRRNPDMLLDLIRTHAALFQCQRVSEDRGGMRCITATREDFDAAARLFAELNGESGSQDTKLTRREADLIRVLSGWGRQEVSITQLQNRTGWSNSSVNKIIHGYQSYGKSYSGLLAKCPAISFLDRTVMRGDDGYTTMRRTRVYLWDQEIYEAWIRGGMVWIADGRESGDDCRSPPDPDNLTGSESPLLSGERRADSGQSYEIPDLHPYPHPDPGGQQDALMADTWASDPDDDLVQRQELSSGVALASIEPRNFTRVDGFADSRCCSVCGRRPTQYRERFRASRAGMSSYQELRLCASCYDRAVSRQAAAIIALPGVIETGGMAHVDIAIGTCQLCSLRPAVWSDPTSRLRLCDSCYQRECHEHKAYDP